MAAAQVHPYEHGLLWSGPAKLATIRTSKVEKTVSLLQSSYKEPTAIHKQPREGLVPLNALGFDGDEHYFAVHGGPEQAVLQYNPDHYTDWPGILKEQGINNDDRRDKLLRIGGFGENIAVDNTSNSVAMDERTMCVGDLVAIRSSDSHVKRVERARMRVTGPRNPCFKLNHRFGVKNMSQLTQNLAFTGWVYSVEKEGEAQVGDELVLLERPYPEWPIARIQHYMFKDTKNFDQIREALDTLGKKLVYGVRDIFEKRLTHGVEDMNARLQGEKVEDIFVNYRLSSKRKETGRVSEFTFERVEQLELDSAKFRVAESGSHIRLRFKVNDQLIVRPYSVISGNSNKFNLGIALADKSRGGSSFLHQQLAVGNIVEVSDKFANTFALEASDVDHHVFLAGGIGITAFLDHIQYCVKKRKSFTLHYMIRNKTDYAFRKSIERMINRASDADLPSDESDGNSSSSRSTSSLSEFGSEAKASTSIADKVIYVSSEGGRCDIPKLMSNLSDSARTHVYICGSEKMADAVEKSAEELKIPKTRLHFEQFTLDSSGDPFVADLSITRKKLQVGSDQTLLEALRSAGLDIPSTCEAGNCGTCRVSVKCGRVAHKGTALAESEKAGYEGTESGDMLSCVSRGVGTIEIEL